MRAPLLVLFVCLLGNAEAQPHPGPLTLGGGNPVPNPIYMAGQFLLDKTSGRLTTLIDTSAVPRPLGMRSIVYGVRNETVLFGTGDTSGPGYALTNGVYRYDLKARTYSTVVMQPYWSVDSLVPDGNDDLLALVSTGSPRRLLRIRRDGSVTTLTPSGSTVFFPPRLFTNVYTGDILVQEYSSPRKVFQILSVSTYGVMKTVYTGVHGLEHVSGAGQFLADGCFYYAHRNHVFRWGGGSARPTSIAPLPVTSPEGASAFVFENQADAVSRAYVLTSAAATLPNLYVQRLHHLDPRVGFTVTKSIDVVPPSTTPKPQPFPADRLLSHRSRYVSSAKTAPGTWRLHFSFPAHPGKSYIAAAGMSGVRPPQALADGRIVWLHPDPLFTLTLTDGIPRVWDSGPLRLDGSGHATGRLDVSSWPTPLRVTIHIVAAVLDPKAPLGIAFVTEPHPIQL